MTSSPLKAPDHVQRIAEGLATSLAGGWLGLAYMASMTLTRERGVVTTKFTVKADLAKGYTVDSGHLTMLNTENEKLMNRYVEINQVMDDLDIYTVTFGVKAEDSPDGGWTTAFIYYLAGANEYHKKRFFAESLAADHIGCYLMTGVLDGDPFP